MTHAMMKPGGRGANAQAPACLADDTSVGFESGSVRPCAEDAAALRRIVAAWPLRLPRTSFDSSTSRP